MARAVNGPLTGGCLSVTARHLATVLVTAELLRWDLEDRGWDPAEAEGTALGWLVRALKPPGMV